MTNSPSDFYRSPINLSYFALAGLALVGACDLAGALLGVGQIVSPSYSISLDEVESQSVWILLQALLAVLKLPVFIFTVVFFLIWLNRAHKNLNALQAQNLEFTSGWSVGWWFIPFANLIKPFQVVREVWRESDPDFDASFLSNSISAPSFFSLWWGFWIASNVASNISSRMLDFEDPKSLEISGYFFVLEGILSITAAILAIKVIREITTRQEMRFQRIGAMRQYEPPPPPQFN